MSEQAARCHDARTIEALARTRLSTHFLLRDFLFSSHAAAMGASNLPEDPALAIRAGRKLCEHVLEPILKEFGHFAVTYGYQSRQVTEVTWTTLRRRNDRHSSSPHQWDRRTFGDEIYARVDILPFAVEDGIVTKHQFGHWLMHNLDIDLLMQWTRSNVACITISPRPRRVWLEWGRPSLNEPRQTIHMGAHYWQRLHPRLPSSEQPRFGPSATGGRIQWGRESALPSRRMR